MVIKMDLFCKNCKQTKNPEDFYYYKYKKKNGEITVYRSYVCKQCVPLIRKKKYHSDKEYRQKQLDANKEWRKKNRKHHLENRRKWREKNREKIRKRAREFYRKNRERLLKKTKEYHQSHKDYYYRKYREWHKKLRSELIKLLGGKCVVCGETNEDFLEFDHIKPLRGKRRGNILMEVKNNPELFQLLCANHHRRKTSNERKCKCPYCGSHNVKTYSEYIMAKVKQDTPKPKTRKIKKGQVELPPIPEGEIFGAINHAHQELGDEDFKDVRKAMPLIARMVSEECKKHFYSGPTGALFHYYKEYLASHLSSDGE